MAKKAKRINSLNVAMTLREMPINSIITLADYEATNAVVKVSLTRLMADGTRLYTSTKADGGTTVVRMR